MTIVLSRIAYILTQSAKYKGYIRASKDYCIYQASDFLLVFSNIDSSIVVSCRLKLLVVSYWDLFVFVSFCFQPKLLKYCSEVLFLIKVDILGFPVTGNSYTENLINLLQVLGIELSGKLFVEPVDLFLLLYSSNNVVNINK